MTAIPITFTRFEQTATHIIGYYRREGKEYTGISIPISPIINDLITLKISSQGLNDILEYINDKLSISVDSCTTTNESEKII